MEGVGFFSSFKTEIFDLIKQGKNEFDDWFKIGLSEYIEDRNSKFKLTNTFFRPEAKFNFYDVFFPIQLASQKKKVNSTAIIDALFTENRAVALLGNIGSGKSMLVKHIFLSAYKQSFKIPILVELRNLNNTTEKITDYIYKSILKNRIKPSSKILERTLRSGDYLFIFDGYDELYSNRKEIITDEIENFIDNYNLNYFLIISRPHCGLESLSRFINFYLQPLNSAEVQEFMSRQLKLYEDPELLEKINIALQKPENKSYYEYLSNPLLLSMFLVVFSKNPELPKSKNKFYWNVFDTLCTKHDSSIKKAGWLHERKSGLQNEDLEKVLKVLSYRGLFESRYTFDDQYLKDNLHDIKNSLGFKCTTENLLYDLRNSISILWSDGLDIHFPHTTLQDYFAASYIKDLDEKDKNTVYSVKLFKLSKISLSLESFWNLCAELDKHAFYTYFLIAVLKNFIAQYQYDQKDFNQMLAYQDFLNNLKFEALIEITESGEVFLKQSWANENIVAVNIAKYLGLNFLEEIDVSSYTDEQLNYAIQKYAGRDTIVEKGISSTNNKLVSIRFFSDSEAGTDFLRELKMPEKVNRFVDFIRQSINSLQKEIDSDNYKKLWDI